MTKKYGLATSHYRLPTTRLPTTRLGGTVPDPVANPPIIAWAVLLPHGIILALALLTLLADLVMSEESWRGPILTSMSVIGYGGAIVGVLALNGRYEETFSKMAKADDLAGFLMVTMLAAALMTVFIAATTVPRLQDAARRVLHPARLLHPRRDARRLDDQSGDDLRRDRTEFAVGLRPGRLRQAPPRRDRGRAEVFPAQRLRHRDPRSTGWPGSTASPAR